MLTFKMVSAYIRRNIIRNILSAFWNSNNFHRYCMLFLYRIINVGCCMHTALLWTLLIFVLMHFEENRMFRKKAIKEETRKSKREWSSYLAREMPGCDDDYGQRTQWCEDEQKDILSRTQWVWGWMLVTEQGRQKTNMLLVWSLQGICWQ